MSVNSKDVYVLPANCSVALDFVRVISAQMVVVGHGISYFGIMNFLQQPRAPYMQNIAVLFFFLLSGLLISYSTFSKLQKNPGYSFPEYFIDRFSRIYTSYLPSIIFVVFVDLLNRYVAGPEYAFAQAFNLKTFIGNLFMLQDYPLIGRFIPLAGVTSFGSARPFWSLAIEWWIYLWFGWFVYKYFRNEDARYKWYEHLVCLFFCVVPIWNLVNGRGTGLTFVWLMGVGICLALIKIPAADFRPRLAFFLSASCLALALVRVIKTKVEYDVLFAGLLGLFLLFLLIGLANSSISFGKTFDRSVKFAANYSFTLYLIHYSILDIINYLNAGKYNPYAVFVFAFVICNIIAAFIAYFTEFRHKQAAAQLRRLLLQPGNNNISNNIWIFSGGKK